MINYRLIRLSDEWLHVLLLFLMIFSVYLWSAPRTVVLEDDGYFILASYFNGIAHPPGYPLYTLLGHFATKLQLGSVALRVHALSALFGTLSCVFLYLITRTLIQERIFAYTAALGLGLSRVFWSQSLIADVYTLNALLVLALLFISIQFISLNSFSRSWLPQSMGLLYGLGLSNHWPLLGLSSPMLIAVLWPKWRELLGRSPAILPCVLLGLLPYIHLVIQSQADPKISFFGPIISWSDFWVFVSRQDYAQIDYSPSATWIDKLRFSIFVLQETASQFGPFGIIFVVFGFIYQWRLWPKNICVGLVLGYLFSTFVLIGLLGLNKDHKIFNFNYTLS